MARTVTVHGAPRLSSAAGDCPGESETPFHGRESVTIGSLESWNTNTALPVLLVKMDQELQGKDPRKGQTMEGSGMRAPCGGG